MKDKHSTIKGHHTFCLLYAVIDFSYSAFFSSALDTYGAFSCLKKWIRLKQNAYQHMYDI